MEHQEVLAQLKERLRQMERSHRRIQEPPCSTGTPLDPLLPERGLEWGTLIEWLSEGEGTGMATLALIISAHLLARQGAFVVIDSRREFYPAAAAGLGIPLERTVVVQPANAGDGLWAWEQSLRSPAVSVVLGWLEELKERAFRRLQLAAETGGGLGFLLRPSFCRTQPSWAEMRLLVEALPPPDGERRGVSPPCSSAQRRLRVELLRCRGGLGRAIELELSDEEVHVCMASRLAHPAPAARAARA